VDLCSTACKDLVKTQKQLSEPLLHWETSPRTAWVGEQLIGIESFVRLRHAPADGNE
jgi:hypothetical protein